MNKRKKRQLKSKEIDKNFKYWSIQTKNCLYSCLQYNQGQKRKEYLMIFDSAKQAQIKFIRKDNFFIFLQRYQVTSYKQSINQAQSQLIFLFETKKKRNDIINN
ncbi:hypothetical protein ABPG72_003286 [Tetrahymena utriculariae]